MLKNLNINNKCQKNWKKNASFVKKNAKIRGVEILKNIPLHLETIE